MAVSSERGSKCAWSGGGEDITGGQRTCSALLRSLEWIQAEEMSEGAGRSDGGQLGDADMDIAGLSVPPAQGMDGLHGAAQTHPFSSAGNLAATFRRMQGGAACMQSSCCLSCSQDSGSTSWLAQRLQVERDSCHCGDKRIHFAASSIPVR